MIDGYYQSMQTPKQPRVNQGSVFSFGQNNNLNSQQAENKTIEDDVINSINQQLINSQNSQQQWGKDSLYKIFTTRKDNKGKYHSKSEEFSSNNSSNLNTENDYHKDDKPLNKKKLFQGSNSNDTKNIEMPNINQNNIRKEIKNFSQQSSSNISGKSEDNNDDQSGKRVVQKRSSKGRKSDEEDEAEEEDYQSFNLPQKKVNWNKSFLNESIENMKMQSSILLNKSSSFNLKETEEDINKSTNLQDFQQTDKGLQQKPFQRQPGKRAMSYAHPQNNQLSFGNNLQQNNISRSSQFQADLLTSQGQINESDRKSLSGQVGATPQSATIPENKQEKDKILKVFKNAKIRYFLQKCKFNLSSFNRQKKLEKKHFKVMDKSAVPEDDDTEELTASENIQRQLKQIIVGMFEIMPVISPSSHFKIIWDVCQMVLLIYTFWVIPLCISTGLDLDNLVGDPISHITIPIILLLDLIVAMNTGYNKNGATVLEKDKILNHYYHEGGLLLDVFALLSIICLSFRKDHIEENLDNYKDPTTYFLVIYFVKYIQFGIIAKRVEDRLDLSSKKKNALALFNLFSNVLLISHFITCIWIFTGRYQQLTNGNSYLNKREIYDMSWFTWYIQTIYYVVVTMTTVGYGDIVPATSIEFLVSVIIMLFACGIFAYNVNAIGAILDEFYRQKRIIDEKMAVINAYMSRHNINLNLRYQIRDYLENFWKQSAEKHEELESVIINDLPKYLQKDLIDEVNHVVLKKSPIFRNNFSRNVCMRLSHILKEVHFPPNQIICQQDTIDDSSIYFIRNGTVQITYNQSITNQQNQQQIQSTTGFNQISGIPQLSSPQTSFLNTSATSQSNSNNQLNLQQQLAPFSQQFYFLNIGDSFGEISFFTGYARCATIKAVDFTTLIKIERSEFIQLLQTSSADYEKFCLIKDQISFSQKYHDIGVKCYSCNRQDHLMSQCPVVHSVPNKQVTIRRYIYSPQISDRVKHTRSNRGKFSSLKENSLLKLACKELYPDGIFDYQSGDELESTDSSGLSSSSSLSSSNSSGSNSESEKRSRSSSLQSLKSKKSSTATYIQNNEHKLSHFVKFNDKNKSPKSEKSDNSSENSNSDSGSQSDLSTRNKSKSITKNSNKQDNKFTYNYNQHQNKELNQISETRQEEDLSDANSESSQNSVKINSYKKLPPNSLTRQYTLTNSKSNKITKDIINDFNSFSKSIQNQEKRNSRAKKDSINSPKSNMKKAVQSSFSSKSSSLLLQNFQNDPFGLSQQLNMTKNLQDQNKQQENKSVAKGNLKQIASSNNVPENQNQQLLMKLFQKLVDKFVIEENAEGQDASEQKNQDTAIFDSSSDLYQDYQIYYPNFNQSIIIKKYNDLTTKQNQSAFFMAFQVSKKQDPKADTEAESPTKGARGRSSVFLKFNPRFSIAPPGLR